MTVDLKQKQLYKGFLLVIKKFYNIKKLKSYQNFIDIFLRVEKDIKPK